MGENWEADILNRGMVYLQNKHRGIHLDTKWVLIWERTGKLTFYMKAWLTPRMNIENQSAPDSWGIINKN